MMSIDFETRSTVPIKNGLCNYLKNAEVLFLGHDNGLWDFRKNNTPEELLDYVAEGGQISAWNAMFEYWVWNTVMKPRYNWPKLRLEQLTDTMAMAAACNLPQGLAACGTILNMDVSSLKNPRGKYLIGHLCKPRRQTNNNSDIYFQEDDLLDEFGEYCKQDVKAEKAIYDILPKLSEYEQRIWVLTQKMNIRGVPIDRDLVNMVVRMREENAEQLQAKSQELLGFSVTQTARLTAYLGLPDIQAATLTQALKTATCDQRTAILLRQQLGGTGSSKFVTIQNALCDDDTVKNMFNYHGAGTGRWASRGGNMQNFTRPIYDQDVALQAVQIGDLDFLNMIGNASDYFSSITRAMVHGKLIDADFSSIENRVASWISGDTETLELFKDGLDQYKDLAMTMYHVSYDAVTSKQRQVAKSGVLGGQFGQGAKGFIKFAAGYGVKIELEESQKIIDAYRAKYSKIVKMWNILGKATINAIRHKGEVVHVGDKLKVLVRENFLLIRLPSGRKLHFYAPLLEMLETPWGELRQTVTAIGVDKFNRNHHRIKIIGSNFFQSVVQGIARDLLAHAFDNMDKHGIQVRSMIHDELIADQHPDVDLEKFCKIMCDAPAWAEGLPLEASGWIGERYRK